MCNSSVASGRASAFTAVPSLSYAPSLASALSSPIAPLPASVSALSALAFLPEEADVPRALAPAPPANPADAPPALIGAAAATDLAAAASSRSPAAIAAAASAPAEDAGPQPAVPAAPDAEPGSAFEFAPSPAAVSVWPPSPIATPAALA
ncbi:hypothetical protein BKA62DRAFT_721549 [Auriculariales sp. MPI-PUGE-AT-0066]|nr:hypothetical protein BKA62DRAFT_721549 [Auriculariales sp. MPI-PUGE-AT-0066]